MALFWITVGALMGNVTDGTERDQWNNVVIAACTVPAGIVVAYAAYYISTKEKKKEKGENPDTLPGTTGHTMVGNNSVSVLSKSNNLIF